MQAIRRRCRLCHDSYKYHDKNWVHARQNLHKTIQAHVKITSTDQVNLSQAIATHSVLTIPNTVLDIEPIQQAIEKRIMEHISITAASMNHKLASKGCVSKLIFNDFDNLNNFTWTEFIDKVAIKMPLLVNILLSVAASDWNISHTLFQHLMPRLAVVYSILMQSQHTHLSRIQRLITLCLCDNICD